MLVINCLELVLLKLSEAAQAVARMQRISPKCVLALAALTSQELQPVDGTKHLQLKQRENCKIL